MSKRPPRLTPKRRTTLCAELLVPHVPRGFTALVAEDEHLEELAARSREAFGDAALTTTDLRRYVHKAHAMILGLQKRGAIVAYCLIELNAGQRRIYVVETYTASELRGKGYGSWLRGRVDAIGETLGYRSVTSHVSVRNTPALKLNEKAGMTIVRQIPGYYDDGRAAFYLRKLLPGG
jgi:ribosomal protein S18 acetylase RimI-like enzyme